MDLQRFVLVGNSILVNYAIEHIQKLGHEIDSVITTSKELENYCIKCAIPTSDSQHPQNFISTKILVLDTANDLQLCNDIYKAEVYFLHSLIGKLTHVSYFNIKIFDSIKHFWSRLVSVEKNKFDLIEVVRGSYNQLSDFFIDILHQLVIKISREEVKVTVKNDFYKASKLIAVPSSLSKKNIIALLTAGCAAFHYKFFNAEEIMINYPKIGLLNSSFLGSYPYINSIIYEVIASENMTINTLVNNIKIRYSDKEFSENDENFHLIVPIITSDIPNSEMNFKFFNFLVVFFIESSGQCSMKIAYDEQIKKDYNYEQLEECFVDFIQKTLHFPEVNIDSLKPLTTQWENKFLSAYASYTGSNNLKFNNLVSAFEYSANTNQDRVALRYYYDSLTYRQLSERINKLACYLESFSIKSNCIGVFINNTFDLIISVLGVMKAGFIYLPLDPKLPDNRVKNLIEISGADIILTNKKCINRLAKLNVSIIEVDSINYDENKFIHVKEKIYQDAAYLIFTSGSSGAPKGVLCTHIGALNMIQCTIETYPVTKRDRLLLLASYGFDISIWEIFCPLLIGGELVLPEEGTYSDLQKLISYIDKYKITLLHMVPSALKYLVKHMGSEQCASLKLVVSGGENLEVDTARIFKEKLPNCQLYHGYGPTETAITSLHYCVEKADCDKNRLPIGKPLHYVNILIVNSKNQLLPEGVRGELLIGGIGIAKGYFQDEMKTSHSFIPVNFNEHSPKIFYKSGDFVKLNQQGLINYYGRIDNQIKINGNRIEIEEIECHLKKHPEVEEAIVLSSNNIGSIILLAFIKIKNNKENNHASMIKRKLKASLPKYMQPAKYIFINEIPILSSGKIDRRKLLEYHNTIDVAEALPETSIELRITDYLSQATDLEAIPVTSNFLAMGFNSLLITQLAAYINSIFYTAISPYEIDKLGTIRSLAAFIEGRTVSAAYENNTIKSISRNKSLALSHAQKRLWFVHQVEDQKSHAYNIINTYKIIGPLQVSILEKTIESLIKRHESLRTLFKNTFGKPHQVIVTQLSYTLELLIVDEDKLSSAIKSFCSYEFKLDKEFSAKFCLFTVKDKNYHFFAILQHNIITDGWSTGVLIRDLSTIYNAFFIDKPVKLPELNVQYVDFAAWQNSQINDGYFDNQLTYWATKLAGYSELDFPLSFPRKSRQTFLGHTINFTLEKQETDAIDRFIKNSRITLYSFLISALNIVLYHYCDQDDIVIGSAAANRGQVQMREVMGFFVNIFPLRTELTNNPTVNHLIIETHRVCMEAISNQDIPFDVLIDKLKIERESNRSPLFQLLFLMQDAFDNTNLELTGCSIEPENITLDTSIFDITFNVFKNESQITISCQYNKELFSEEFIHRFLQCYRRVIALIPNKVDDRINTFNILTENDFNAIALCNSAKIYENNKSFLCMFLESVKLYPRSTALIDTDNIISYSLLNHHAEQIASQLLTQDKQFIAIIMGKSISYLTAMIAVMKSGNIYVPLDATLPMQRIASILQSAAIKTIITDSFQNKEILSHNGMHNLNIININQYNKSPVNKTEESLVRHNGKQSELVYTIYTSGSTGTPKGVKVSHGNLSNVLLYFKDILQVNHQSRLLSLTTVTFDIFQLEGLLPLIAGGACHLFDLNDSSLNLLAEVIEKFQPTHIQATPATWKLIFNTVGDINLKNLIALTGGEALDMSLLMIMQQRVAKIINVYGPTETTIWSTMADLSQSKSVHIGKPIANTNCYIIDSRFNVVPIGCKGQLIISGKGVSQGYMNSAQTKQAFVEKKLGNLDKKDRFYKTGDYALLDHDGSIKYFGRIDEQIKIRGYRIELEEVAHIIKKVSYIDDAVAIIINKFPDLYYESILIAFVVIKEPHDEKNLQQNLHNFCARFLPRYMIPASFLVLKSIPLNARGKTDKYVLKQHYLEHLSVNKTLRELTITERLISTIWQDVLEIENINIESTFYNLGGHSLLVPIMLSNVMRVTDCTITIREFIERPTIRELACYLDSKKILVREKKDVTTNDAEIV